MTYLAGNSIPVEARLSDQFVNAHGVRFSGVVGGGGGVALDDFSFNPVTPVPEAGALAAIGLGVWLLRRRAGA